MGTYPVAAMRRANVYIVELVVLLMLLLQRRKKLRRNRSAVSRLSLATNDAARKNSNSEMSSVATVRGTYRSRWTTCGSDTDW